MSKISTIIFLVFALTIPAQSAWAESSRDRDSISIAFPAAEAVGAVVLLGIFTTVMRDDLISTTNFSRVAGYQNPSRMQSYLRENYIGLQQDLHLGGGDAMRELAQIFDVSQNDYQLFAEELSINRSRLLALSDPETLTLQRAAQFSELVAELLPAP